MAITKMRFLQRRQGRPRWLESLRREGSPEWHRARANSLREHGFTKMAEEHEQIAREIEQRREQQRAK
jgi:hypothetical protein